MSAQYRRQRTRDWPMRLGVLFAMVVGMALQTASARAAIVTIDYQFSPDERIDPAYLPTLQRRSWLFDIDITHTEGPAGFGSSTGSAQNTSSDYALMQVWEPLKGLDPKAVVSTTSMNAEVQSDLLQVFVMISEEGSWTRSLAGGLTETLTYSAGIGGFISYNDHGRTLYGVHDLVRFLQWSQPEISEYGSRKIVDANGAIVLQQTVGRIGHFVKMTSVVPEPATWALMICGFGLTGSTLRRRPVALSTLSSPSA